MNTVPTIFNNEFIREVCKNLDKNRPIRRKFLSWGRLHIDRRLPFLCIYRLPAERPDQGTERLLLGQASYILIGEEDAGSGDFKALVKAIIARLSSTFGGVLLFEIWTEGSDEPLDNQPQRAVFNIRTTKQQAPHAMLEELESALWELPFKNRSREVLLNYSTQFHPDGMSSLLSYEDLVRYSCYWVGLGTSPIYRQNGQLLPYILRQMHQYLTQVLRRSFYIFSLQYTKHKPAHLHELGRRSMTGSVWKTDKQLAAIKNQYDLLFHVTPVNTDEAWLAFQQSNYTTIPMFNYRPRPIDPNLLKRQLYDIPIEKIEDPTLSHIFHTQREEIDRQLTMINDRNNKNFIFSSLQVYGGVESCLLVLARRILNEIQVGQTGKSAVYLSADEFATRAGKILADYRKEMPELQSRVEIRDDIPGILVSRGNLMIGRHSRFAESTSNATLAHEVGTHIVTYLNGKSQPFHQLYSGMANYEPLQEGLAVLAEYLVGELRPRRLRNLAARVIAVHSLVDGADFLEVFRLLTIEFNFSPFQAYYVTMRVFRGGGFTKDAVYLRGLSRLLNYLKEGGDVEILYLGKIAQENIDFVDELKWRRVLKPGPLQPHYLKTEQCKSRMQTLRKGISIIDLIEA